MKKTSDANVKRGLQVSWENFNWLTALFLIGYHIFLAIALPIYFLHHTPAWSLILWTIALVYITGMAITALYHRLYSHTTYKLHPIVEGILLIFATMATQGSALQWAFSHRHHHAFVDTDRDPYSIKKGFWYAHFLWLLEKPIDIDKKVVADLVRKPLVMFQHKYYSLLMVVTNTLLFLLFGWCFGNYWESFLFIWFVRLFFLHHFTWFINSLAHTWGARHFCQELSAVDNYLISLVTFGEGYHNYHHTFAYDYRNGVRWYHFDPTKWLIWTLSKLGLARKLKKNQNYFIEKKIVLDKTQILLEKIRSSSLEHKEAWEKRLTKLTENILGLLKEISQCTELYQGIKKKKEEKLQRLDLQRAIKLKKKGLKKETRDWVVFGRNIMGLSKGKTFPTESPLPALEV